MKKDSLPGLSLAGLGLIAALAACGHREAPVPATTAVDATVDPRLKQINHFVVIYLENRSFDHLFGNFPGANGRANAGDSSKQLDKNSVELAALNKEKNIPSQPDPRFPPANGDAPLPNAPFDIGRYVPPGPAYIKAVADTEAEYRRLEQALEYATYQYHHNPLTYFRKYDEGTQGRAEHLKDYDDMMTAIKNDQLPQVAFYKPLGKFNQHSGYSNIIDADRHLKEVIDALQSSKAWEDTAVIITYDEFGGYWDHVAPPKLDQWGPGPRIPALIVAKHAKRGYVDHTFYDTTSILATLEHRFGLTPLTDHDKNANDLANAFEMPGTGTN